MITSTKYYTENKKWTDRILGQMLKAKLYRQIHTNNHTHTHSQKEKKEKNIYIYIYKKTKEEERQPNQ